MYLICRTRHTASTSMYSLTFCVRVTTPPQYGLNGTAHAAGASILSPVRGVFAARRACGVWWACLKWVSCDSRHYMAKACAYLCQHHLRRHAGVGEFGEFPLGSATHFHSVAIATQSVHRLQIRPIVHNYGTSPTTPPSYIRVRAIV